MADITGHTPVPWSIGKRRWITSGDVDIARIHDVSRIGEAEAVANAEFIVRACNSHDALLEALERAYQALSDIINASGTCECNISHGLGRGPRDSDDYCKCPLGEGPYKPIELQEGSFVADCNLAEEAIAQARGEVTHEN